MAEDTRIGGKIRTLRESLNLSASDLAERCACDVGVIDGLEAGDIVPSLAPLIKITRALGVRLGTLLDDDTNLGPIVTRRGDAEEAAHQKSLETQSESGVLDFFSLAASKASRHMEPFLIDVTPGAVDGVHSLSSHEGEEFIYVIAGAIEVEYGKNVDVLRSGDSIYYDSIVPHQVRAHNGAARILAVVYAPL